MCVCVWGGGGGHTLESRGGSLLQLLCYWLSGPSVNATHRASLLERRGYLCDRMQEVCVGACIRVRSAFVARCKIEFVCVCPLMGVCA